MKNVLSKKALTGALALAIAIPGISYAATDAETDTGSEAAQESVESGETEIRSLLQQFKNGELSEDEVLEKLQEQKRFFFQKGGHHFEDLDDETKEKLEEIKSKVEAGEWTKEEAKAELEELGIEHPRHHGGKGHRISADLTEEQRTQLDEIREQVESGELTEEEAQAQLEELGIEIKPRGQAPDTEESEEAETTASAV
ncbi:hypothetical protein JF544_02820 [Halobacillus kuroshimensis]|uniref:Uncharacterized protein n=1 Tax=Halobacillus kuroshimensis TaxID=302481 RepID=A0ABS3DSF1_9BACI|nr:hypothetical protein [Halobacillus kuroshimensis]MBN8234158.1 hypothetical protein [Halobacillus kuroshimensis]